MIDNGWQDQGGGSFSRRLETTDYALELDRDGNGASVRVLKLDGQGGEVEVRASSTDEAAQGLAHCEAEMANVTGAWWLLGLEAKEDVWNGD